MGMWNDTCKCIDENWKALKARIQASITGITVNGTTHYQTDGTGICDLGIIAGDAITGIEGTAVGHVQMLKLTDGVGSKEYVSIGQFDGTQFDVTVDSETGIPQFKLAETVTDDIGKSIWNNYVTVEDDGHIQLNSEKNNGDGSGCGLLKTDPSDITVTLDGMPKLALAENVWQNITDATELASTAKEEADGCYTTSSVSIYDGDTLGIRFVNASGSSITNMMLKAGTDFAIAYDEETGAPKISLSDDVTRKIGLSYLSAFPTSNTENSALLMDYIDNDGSTTETTLFNIGENLSLVQGEDGNYTLNATGGSSSAPVTVTTYGEYIQGTPSVGDIVIFSSSESVSTVSIKPNYTITTGTYGAEMRPSGSMIQGVSATPYIHQTLGFMVTSVTDTMINGIWIICSGRHTDIDLTMNASISIDGADAISASVNIVSSGTPHRIPQYNATILRNQNTAYHNSIFDGTAIYEGISTTVAITVSLPIYNGSAIYVLKS